MTSLPIETPPVETQPVEREVALDMIRRGLPAVPVLLVAAAVPWGSDGAVSAAYALGLVLANFLAAAAMLGWGARRGPTALLAAALGGFVLRMGMVAAAVLLVADAGWVERVPLGLTIVITHLGLLTWELRFVSVSLAFPGLKPKKGAR